MLRVETPDFDHILISLSSHSAHFALYWYSISTNQCVELSRCSHAFLPIGTMYVQNPMTMASQCTVNRNYCFYVMLIWHGSPQPAVESSLIDSLSYTFRRSTPEKTDVGFCVKLRLSGWGKSHRWSTWNSYYGIRSVAKLLLWLMVASRGSYSSA